MDPQDAFPESPSMDSNGITRRDLIRRAGGGAAIALSGSSLLAACGGSSSASTGSTAAGAAKHGGDLKVAFVGEGLQETLDPGLQVASIDAARAANLFDTLFRVEPGNVLSNELAESFEPNSTATEWTARLRSGVHWHDGKPLTADDLMYSINRVAAPGSKFTAAASLTPLNAPAMKKLDNLTVRIPLHSPVAQLPLVFANSNMSIVQNGAQDPFKHPIGTGPFMFKSFTPGQNSLFVRNPNYWKSPLPYVDSLTFIDIPDGSTRLNAVSSGQVDAGEMVTFAQGRANANSPNVKILESPAGVIVDITMAVDLAPFNDVRVRQAFRLIADRPKILEAAQSGYGSVGNDLFGKDQEYYDTTVPQREQDIEKAKFLLHQAGADNLHVLLYSSTVVAGMLESANAFAQQAKAAGVTVQVNNGPASTYYSDHYLKAPFMQSQWSATPISTWMNFAVLSNSPYNETHWRRPDFDKMVRAAEAELDKAKAQTLWNDAQQMLWDEGGYLIWGFQPYLDALSPKVQGARGNDYFNLGNYDFRTWWLT